MPSVLIEKCISSMLINLFIYNDLPLICLLNLCRMGEKSVNIGLYYGGEFRRTNYCGGDRILVCNEDADTFAYNDLMQEIKDLLKLTEIGGVYAKDGKHGGWKLMTSDLDIIEEIEKCNNGEEVKLYVDTIVDPSNEPLYQMQPHVIVRRRKSLFQGIHSVT